MLSTVQIHVLAYVIMPGVQCSCWSCVSQVNTMDNKRMNTFLTCVPHLSERLSLCRLHSVRLIIQDLEEILDLKGKHRLLATRRSGLSCRPPAGRAEGPRDPGTWIHTSSPRGRKEGWGLVLRSVLQCFSTQWAQEILTLVTITTAEQSVFSECMCVYV